MRGEWWKQDPLQEQQRQAGFYSYLELRVVSWNKGAGALYPSTDQELGRGFKLRWSPSLGPKAFPTEDVSCELAAGVAQLREWVPAICSGGGIGSTLPHTSDPRPSISWWCSRLQYTFQIIIKRSSQQMFKGGTYLIF